MINIRGNWALLVAFGTVLAVLIGALALWYRNPRDVAIIGVLRPDGHLAVTDWEQVADLDELLVQVSHCGGRYGVKVVETSPDQVEIQVTSHRLDLAGRNDCSDLVPVGLKHLVGDRTLIDGSSGEPVPLARPDGETGQ